MRNFCGRILLILKGLSTFVGIVEIIEGKIITEKIKFTNKKYFLLHKTLKQLFCKATNIIAEIQKVGNPEQPLTPFQCCEGCQTISISVMI